MNRISDLIGKPFREFGRGPKYYDCYGLFIQVRKELGMPVHDYGSLPCSKGEEIVERFEQAIAFHEVTPTTSPEPGDIVWLRGVPNDSHLGVVIDAKGLLTTSEGAGVQYVEFEDRAWKHLIKGFYKWTTIE